MASRLSAWNLADLVKFNPTTYNLVKIETVERQCQAGRNQYKIRFEGIPGASNAMWMCGAGTRVHASVWRNGKMVFDEDRYKCNGVDASEIDRHSSNAPPKPTATQL